MAQIMAMGIITAKRPLKPKNKAIIAFQKIAIIPITTRI
tara:strand:+ start:30 stop:146 length:117 start_codon:yes stop_codon:yes gene_type:complete